MEASRNQGRWLCMLATLIICVCAGFGYAWSVLQTPFVVEYNWPEGSVSLVYTISVLCATMTPTLLGGFTRKLNTRSSVMIGAVLFGGSLFLVGTMTQLWQLYVYYGVLNGVGAGLIYPRLMAYVVRLYPERSGLASGLGTAAYGSGAILWAPVTVSLTKAASISSAMRIVGGIFLVVILVCGLFLKEVEPAPAAAGGAQSEETGMRRGEMVRTSAFYMAAIAVSCGLTAGVIIISQASPILQQTLSYSSSKAALFVSVFSACNMAGRFLWGGVSDRLGIRNTMSIVFVLSIVAMAALALTSQEVLMIVAMGLGASCYGGFSSMLTPYTAELFGRKYITENYGVMYIVFGIASLVGPVLAVSFKAAGGYAGAFLSAAVLAAVGLVVSRAIRVKR